MLSERMSNYNYHLCLDISSFDSSQRGLIWEIERHLFNTILGERAANIWCAITQNAGKMRDMGGLEFEMPNCRNSGEMSTSLTNTLLSKYLIMYALEQAGITDADYFVEGDDNWTAFNTEKNFKTVVSNILEVYSNIGCQATVESAGTVDSEPTFCKIKFASTKNGLVGFKDLGGALIKATWVDSKYKPTGRKFNRVLIAKLHSLAHTYNYWPRLVHLLNDVANRSQKHCPVDLRCPPTWVNSTEYIGFNFAA